MFVSDKNNKIVRVNKAFQKITRYSQEDIVGKSPSILKSGKHNDSFYKEMWKSIQEHGHWAGELWDKRKDGTVYLKTTNINVVKDENGEVEYYICLFSDLYNIKQKNERIHELLTKDYLTGLENRLSLISHLQEDIVKNKPFAVMFIDLDNFKYVNDTLGHSVGDSLLIAVSNRLKQTLRMGDTIARLGGDEFVVVVRNIESECDASSIAQKILLALTPEFKILNLDPKNKIYVSPSIGISLFPKDGIMVDDLLKNADLAMYQVKGKGKNDFQFYRPELSNRNNEQYDLFSLEYELRCILSNNEETSNNNKYGTLNPYIQPIWDISSATSKTIGYEILTRWEHPEVGFISPSKFIPIAEDFELMNQFFFHIFHKSLEFIKKEKSKLYFNVSPKQLANHEFLDLFSQTINNVNDNKEVYGIQDNVLDHIGLEFTENALMYNQEEIIEKLLKLREMGVELVIDDFGTGYSSLSYLAKLPIQKLKIDGAFIRDIDSNKKNAAIVQSVISLCNNLHINVVAECVETKEQLAWLKYFGCNHAQGYLLGKPKPINS